MSTKMINLINLSSLEWAAQKISPLSIIFFFSKKFEPTMVNLRRGYIMLWERILLAVYANDCDTLQYCKRQRPAPGLACFLKMCPEMTPCPPSYFLGMEAAIIDV